MPIKSKSPKKIIRTEMKKFKKGKLHSGSSDGPIVTNPKQAIAISLSEAKVSKKKRKPSKKRGVPRKNAVRRVRRKRVKKLKK